MKVRYFFIHFCFLMGETNFLYSQSLPVYNVGYEAKVFGICPVSDQDASQNDVLGNTNYVIPYDFYAAFDCDVPKTLDTLFVRYDEHFRFDIESTHPCYVIFYGRLSNGQDGDYNIIYVDERGADFKYRKTVEYDDNSCITYRIIATKAKYALKKNLNVPTSTIPYHGEELLSFIPPHIPIPDSSYVKITVTEEGGIVHQLDGELGNNVYWTRGDVLPRPTLVDVYENANLPLQPYSIFTAQSTNDVEMFVINTDNEIIGHNNDYSGSSVHDWETESRIDMSGNDSVKAIVLLPYCSYLEQEDDYFANAEEYIFQDNNTAGKTDLYLGCRFFSFNGMSSLFPQLDENDALISDRIRNYMYCYNCHAWTAYPRPRYLEVGYLGGVHSAQSIANYLCSSCGFTTIGATEDNSEIDIWEHLGYATHTSVKSYGVGAGGNSFGYAWESKIGPSERIMHPRYALTNDNENLLEAYGHVVMYLIRDSCYNNQDFIYENVEFNDEENFVISQLCSELSEKDIYIFERKYKSISDYVKKFYISNLGLLSLYNKDYQELVDLCSRNKGMLGKLLLNMSAGDGISTYLFIDATKDSYIEAKKRVKDFEQVYNRDAKGNIIIRTDIPEAILYAKEVLADMQGYTRNDFNEGITYSNDEKRLVLHISGQSLAISYELERTANVKLTIENLDGTFQKQLLSGLMQSKGSYNYSLILGGKGVYVVTLDVNTSQYSKKVILN